MRRAFFSLARLSKPAPSISVAFELRPLSSLAPVLTTEAAGPSGWTAAAATAAGTSLAERYTALVAAGTLQHDPQQAACVERLDRLRRELASHSKKARRKTLHGTGAASGHATSTGNRLSPFSHRRAHRRWQPTNSSMPRTKSAVSR
jgi:hypothetical protein